MPSGNPNTTGGTEKDSWDEAILGANKAGDSRLVSSLPPDNLPIKRMPLVPEKKNPLLLPSVGMVLAFLLSASYFFSAEAGWFGFDFNKHTDRVILGSTLTYEKSASIVSGMSDKVVTTFSSGVSGTGDVVATASQSANVGLSKIFQFPGQIISRVTSVFSMGFNSVSSFSEDTVVSIDQVGATAGASVSEVYGYFGNLSDSIKENIILAYVYLGEKTSLAIDSTDQALSLSVGWLQNKVITAVDFIGGELDRANSFLRESKDTSSKRASDLARAAAVGAEEVASSTENIVVETRQSGENLLVKIGDSVTGFGITISNYWNKIVFRWKVFIGLEQDLSEASLGGFSAEDRATLQNVQAGVDEVLRQLADRPVGTTQAPASQSGGAVVVPSSGDPATDAVIKANIANMFSDEVTVKPDGSGRSGVITPVFRSGAGNNCLYIMAPINN